ncbi:MAG TPA: hypothetical protein VE732_07135 [Nitrososphaera sp.]|jgi:hypothetical protein|nr:hypothetical protein [Nitrososphaera sp.]
MWISMVALPVLTLSAKTASPKTVGRKGGKQLTFENIERYFNNTLFVELVQAGWIGSKLMQTAALTDLVRSAIENNKSVILTSLHMQTMNPEQNWP